MINTSSTRTKLWTGKNKAKFVKHETDKSNLGHVIVLDGEVVPRCALSEMIRKASARIAPNETNKRLGRTRLRRVSKGPRLATSIEMIETSRQRRPRADRENPETVDLGTNGARPRRLNLLTEGIPPALWACVV